MGLVEKVLSAIFGGGRNAVVETVEVFRENADKAGARAIDVQQATLEQFGQEFAIQERGLFDRLMDAINRVPRPAMALGTLGLFVAAMVDPVWFAARMQGIALVPEPLWWLLGVVVSFYFGARHQSKGQQFQRDLALSAARVQKVAKEVAEVEAIEQEEKRDQNPALSAWRNAA